MAIEYFTIEKLTDTIIDYRGKTPPKVDKGIRLITAKVIKNGRILDDKHEYIADDFYDTWMRRGLPQKWDILLTTEAPLGHIAMVPDYKHAIGQRVITLSPNSYEINSEYMFWFMQSRMFQEQILEKSTGSTVTGVKQSTLTNSLVIFPKKADQQKIVSILTSIDTQIEKNQKKLIQNQLLKKSLMQDLLTGKVRVQIN